MKQAQQQQLTTSSSKRMVLQAAAQRVAYVVASSSSWCLAGHVLHLVAGQTQTLAHHPHCMKLWTASQLPAVALLQSQRQLLQQGRLQRLQPASAALALAAG
jgi:hypothetical protein